QPLCTDRMSAQVITGHLGMVTMTSSRSWYPWCLTPFLLLVLLVTWLGMAVPSTRMDDTATVRAGTVDARDFPGPETTVGLPTVGNGVPVSGTKSAARSGQVTAT
ncbi:hypothetical protein BaRGS_00008416, partial [Batillaria attramentaria]